MAKNLSVPVVTRMILWSTVVFLLGRSYQHFFMEGAYRALFLDEAIFRGIQSIFSDQSWLAFVNSPRTDAGILVFTRMLAWIWTLTALALVFHRRLPRPMLWVLPGLSSLGLLVYGAAEYLDSGYQWAQWIEHSAQMAMPLLCAFFLRRGASASWSMAARAAVGLTFLGHGLYALGYYPVPGHFVYMTTEITRLSDEAARDVLLIAGLLDLLALVLVFVPRLDRYALLYCVVWGFLTALARPFAYLLFNHLFWITAHQTVFEFVVRVPHFMLPLVVLLAKGPLFQFSSPTELWPGRIFARR